MAFVLAAALAEAHAAVRLLVGRASDLADVRSLQL